MRHFETGHARILVFAFCCSQACGPGGHYARLRAGSEDGGLLATTVQGDSGDRGATASGGSGGSLVASTGGPETGGGASTASGGAGELAGVGGQQAGGDGRGTAGTRGSAGTGGAGGAASTGVTGAAGAGGAASTGATGAAGAGGAASAGGAGAGGAAGTGGPRIISIDFVADDAPPMAPTEKAGVKPAAHWNRAHATSGSLATLTDGSGAELKTTATWTAGGGLWALPWPDAAGDVRMLNSYLDPYSNNAPAVVSVSGLPPELGSGRFDVYVYAYGPLSSGSRRAQYTLGSSSTTISQAGPSATRFPGYVLAPNGGSGNYVVFRNVGGTSFTVTATPVSSSGTNTRAPLNGIQIVFPSGS